LLFVIGRHLPIERPALDRFRQQFRDVTARVVDYLPLLEWPAILTRSLNIIALRLLLTSACNSTPNSRQ
jgi:hypothetical protein